MTGRLFDPFEAELGGLPFEAAEGGGSDGTATPAAIALTAVTPAPTAQATSGSITFGALIGSNFNEASGTTLVITTSVTATVNQWIIVRVSADNASSTTPTFTATDSAGNTYTTAVEETIGAAGTSVAGAIIYAPVTTELPSGGTITITLSNAVVAKVAVAHTFNGIIAQQAGTTSLSSSGTGPSTSITNALSGQLIVAALAFESDAAVTAFDTDTSSGTWSAGSQTVSGTGGTATDHVSIVEQHKITTATASHTFNGSLAASTNYTTLSAVFRPPSGGAATPTAISRSVVVPVPMLSGVGVGGGDLIGSNSNESSGTTLVITTTATVLVGQRIIVRVAADNLSASTPTFTATDSAGNTYTTHVEDAMQAAAATGVAGAIISAFVTTQLDAGGTITITLSGAVVAKTALAHRFINVGNVRSTSVAEITTSSVTVTDSTPVLGDLVVAALAAEVETEYSAFDTDTTNGTWQAADQRITGSVGSSDLHQNIVGQHKAVTGTGSQTWNWTANTTDNLAMLVVFEPYIPTGVATPAAVALTAVTPAPTATGAGGDATASPSAIALTVVAPAPTLSNHPVFWEPFHDFTTNSWVLTGSPTATLVTGRNAGQSPNLAANLGSTIAGNASVLTYTIPSASESDWVVFGTAWKSTSVADIQVLNFTSDTDATSHTQLWVGASGNLQVRSSGAIRASSSTGLIAVDTWYYLEVRFHLGDGTAGSWEVRLNGVTVIGPTSGDTKNGGTKTVYDALRLTPTFNLTSTANYDDAYLDVGPDAAFLGDSTVVEAVLAGSWGPLTGAMTATVEDTPIEAVLAGSWGPLTGAMTATVEDTPIEAVLAGSWGPLTGAMTATVAAFTPAVLAGSWGPLTGAMTATVYVGGVIPGPAFPCGGFTCFGATGVLTINGQVLNCPAWDIPNLARLWAEAAVRGENQALPTVPGVRGYPTRVDQTDFELRLFIRGDVDQTGASAPTPWEGLEANVDLLWANVFAPVTSGRGTKTALLTMPDGSTRIADVQVRPPQLAADVDDPTMVETTFTLTVVSGRFAVLV